MREIKFKGKSKENGKWVTGYLVKDIYGYPIIVRRMKMAANMDTYLVFNIQGFYVDEKTVRQYMEAKDRNGKEVYDGDIVLIPSLDKDVILGDGSGPEEEYNQVVEVIKQDGCFGVMMEKDELFDKRFYSFREITKDVGIQMSEIEVIGNVYDNPKLLKGDEKWSF